MQEDAAVGRRIGPAPFGIEPIVGVRYFGSDVAELSRERDRSVLDGEFRRGMERRILEHGGPSVQVFAVEKRDGSGFRSARDQDRSDGDRKNRFFHYAVWFERSSEVSHRMAALQAAVPSSNLISKRSLSVPYSQHTTSCCP